jgi:curved DNA-binding protein CbpA
MHISLLLVLFSLLSPSSQARSANLYIALGLNTSYVNEKELKRAFRTRAIETHPVKFTNKKNYTSLRVISSKAQNYTLPFSAKHLMDVNHNTKSQVKII